MRLSKRTCRNLQERRNRTRRKTTETPRRAEVRQPEMARGILDFIFILTHSQIPPSSAMKTSVSMDSSDQKKTRMKLKKFLIRRPTYQAVRDKGYIKGRTRRGMCVCAPLFGTVPQ